MSKETFAIINDKDQVVNHILVDKDAPDFEEVMAGQLAHWGCVRYVETTGTEQIIILDEDPEIWTTHSTDEGFVLPQKAYEWQIPVGPAPAETEESAPVEEVTIKGRKYPKDSLLIKENFARRPTGYTLPEGEQEVSLADAE